jgi:hypothetical protein
VFATQLFSVLCYAVNNAAPCHKQPIQAIAWQYYQGSDKGAGGTAVDWLDALGYR